MIGLETAYDIASGTSTFGRNLIGSVKTLSG